MLPAVLALLTAIAVAAPTAATQAATRSDADVERGWFCPLHPEIQHDGPGRCEVCGRALEERAVTHRWVCPIHHEVSQAHDGTCPICGRALEPHTVEVLWRCPSHEAVTASAPGRCPIDGAALVPELKPMAHGDHNPRHGGIFFMAPDRFHHLEGVLHDGRFRLYVYDNYTRPLDPAGVSARLGETPLAPTPDGSALEAPADAAAGELTVWVDFGDGREDRFDFDFGQAGADSSGTHH